LNVDWPDVPAPHQQAWPSSPSGKDGWDHRQLAAELPRHNVLVLPSRFDSFGMVVAEAMACGPAGDRHRNVGAKEVVEDGENGFIIPAETLKRSLRRWAGLLITPAVAADGAPARVNRPSDARLQVYRRRVVESLFGARRAAVAASPRLGTTGGSPP